MRRGSVLKSSQLLWCLCRAPRNTRRVHALARASFQFHYYRPVLVCHPVPLLCHQRTLETVPDVVESTTGIATLSCRDTEPLAAMHGVIAAASMAAYGCLLISAQLWP